MDEDAIGRALAGLRTQVHENHTREITLTREVSRRLEQSNTEIIMAVEHAMHVYGQGRIEIADKLIEVTEKVRHLPAPRGTTFVAADEPVLSPDTGDRLKLY